MLPRKIIHLDMDCFYAAIEVRDRPELVGQPVAVGGAPERRGVLTTCNYEARKYGIRSAMPTFQALQKCPRLVVIPPRFDAYHAESAKIREILFNFTSLVEPLSLDEAFLEPRFTPKIAIHLCLSHRSCRGISTTVPNVFGSCCALEFTYLF